MFSIPSVSWKNVVSGLLGTIIRKPSILRNMSVIKGSFFWSKFSSRVDRTPFRRESVSPMRPFCRATWAVW